MDFLGWVILCVWRECQPRRKGKKQQEAGEWSRPPGMGWEGPASLIISPVLQIHSLYRQTGASFQKAQQEFAAGVFSNPAVRTAAANAAAGAAENAFRAP